MIYLLGKQLEEIGWLEISRRCFLESGFNEKQAMGFVIASLVIHRRIETGRGGLFGGMFGGLL
jgi:hypothetical protein